MTARFSAAHIASAPAHPSFASRLGPAMAAGIIVLIVQLALVAGAGTDIPYQDQWSAEGRQLYPAWVDGGWRAVDLLQPHNEHRIAWTRALDLGLFAANGQWDPLVQLAAIAVLRALVAATLAWRLAENFAGRGRMIVAIGMVAAFLPHLAWQNVLWGFQSSVYFALLFSIATFALLGGEGASIRRQFAGIVCGTAAMFAMGAGLLVPWVLAAGLVLRGIERGRVTWSDVARAWPLLALVVLALALRTEVAGHAGLRPHSAREFLRALGQAAAWPHVWTAVAAWGMNFPIILAVLLRLARRRRGVAGEDFVLLLGGWGMAMAGAMAWTRGGGGEFEGGVPSRYADFLVLLAIANAWCAIALARQAGERWRPAGRWAAAGWAVFLLVGWAGLSIEVMHRLVLPRARDRDAPVVLAVRFQEKRDAAVFNGKPLLYIPERNLGTVAAVLDDPRLRGRLPPSFQPGEPMGPLSRAVRWLLGRN
ncbi:MAG: hypothetical protein JWM88_2643 [Verrucomicrobia bacterium]|nr:hypothetical protein [Verrucomicrobiota bacterium]